MIVDHRETFVINLTMTCRHQTQKLDNDAITIKVLHTGADGRTRKIYKLYCQTF